MAESVALCAYGLGSPSRGNPPGPLSLRDGLHCFASEDLHVWCGARHLWASEQIQFCQRGLKDMSRIRMTPSEFSNQMDVFGHGPRNLHLLLFALHSCLVFLTSTGGSTGGSFFSGFGPRASGLGPLFQAELMVIAVAPDRFRLGSVHGSVCFWSVPPFLLTVCKTNPRKSILFWLVGGP